MNICKDSYLHFLPRMMQKLNKFIFEKYYQRIVKKFPDYIGTSMTLEEGIAKLHHADNHDIYDLLNSTEIRSTQNKKVV